MIIPIRDLKNTTEISRLCHEQKEPVFITKNGYDDMVIMSSDLYKQQHKTHYTISSVNSYVTESVPEYSSYSKGFYSIPEIKRLLTDVFKQYNVKSAILFGSYAKGTDTQKSDIDLVVDSGLRGLAFFGLKEDISSLFKVPVDLIEKYQIKEGSRADKEIKETGIIIYGL